MWLAVREREGVCVLKEEGERYKRDRLISPHLQPVSSLNRVAMTTVYKGVRLQQSLCVCVCARALLFK